MALDNLLAQHLPDMPRLASYASAWDWRDAFNQYLADNRDELFGGDETTYECDKCRDIGFILTKCDKGQDWAAPCSHAQRGGWSRPFFGMPHVQEVSGLGARERAALKRVPCHLLIQETSPRKALGRALHAARELHRQGVKSLRYFDAMGAPDEFGQRWEIEFTPADGVIIGNVDARLSAPRVSSLVDALHALNNKHIIISAAKDIPTGGRWDGLHVAFLGLVE